MDNKDLVAVRYDCLQDFVSLMNISSLVAIELMFQTKKLIKFKYSIDYQ